MKVLDSKTTLTIKSMLRDATAAQGDLHKWVRQLGQDIGNEVTNNLLISDREFTTASNHVVRGSYIAPTTNIVVSTKGDFELFGWGVSDRLHCSIRGYMNFDGVQGAQALNADIREMVLPQVQGTVDLLVIAKAVLATGCTAINLARTAYAKYMPRRLIVASIFYTPIGVNEIQSSLPNSDLYVVGEPDIMNDNGEMYPGFGYLDGRLHA